MKARLASMIVAGTVVSALVVAHAQGSPAGRPDHGRSPLAYVLAPFTFQFGALDLASGTFVPIKPLSPDVGDGLVQGPGRSLFTLGFSGNLYAIDPFTGETSTIGPTGLGDCSVPGSYAPNCALTIGQFAGHMYAADFDNNLYSVNPKTGSAILIGPTGIPALTFAPQSTNPDGTLNVYSENFVTFRGNLYANFATVILDFDAFTFTPVIAGGLYRIDPLTAQAVWVAPLDPNITAMVNVNDTVYGFDAWTGEVVTIDMVTGQTSPPVSVIDSAAGSLIAGAAPAYPFPATDR
jgi:outer membrane protein assembly factor BamB